MSKFKNSTKFKKRNLYIFLFLYKCIIEMIYYFSIAPLYSYSGLSININYNSYFISNFYLFIILLFSPKNKTKPSSYLYVIIEVFLVIPLLVYYWMNNKSFIYTTFVIICLIIISMILKNISFNNVFIKIRHSDFIIKCILIIYLLITVYLVIKRGGIDIRTLNFDSVYELRSESQISGIWGYLMNWSTKVFCPFFAVYFYYKEKYFMTIPIFILQIMMYLSFGFKAFLFSVGVIFMCIYITKNDRFERDFSLVFSIVNLLAYALDFFNISDLLRRAIPYRMIFIPTQIQFEYYEFFKDIDKLHFADSFIGKIFSIESPFSEKIAFVISRYFSYNGVASNSNTGIFSDAYANGGFINMIIFSIIFALILVVIDSTTNRLPTYVVVGSFSYLMFVLNDTPLLTTLLTGGTLLMIFLLILFNSSIENKSDLRNST